jgi:hypothetical protein
MSLEPEIPEAEPRTSDIWPARKKSSRHDSGNALKALILLLVFAIGFGGGFLTGRQTSQTENAQHKNMPQMNEINPPAGYTIQAAFGDIGPKLLAAGAIDLPRFVELYKQAGQPLSDEQMSILQKGSTSPVVINQQNAYFLLNFFWALGLTNENAILTEGQMMAGGKEKAGNFASTGGWTIGTKAPMELYASRDFLPLSEDQQARLLKVASAVYRPCCDNPTHFPDCNHGMAMLGLLELMAYQNASEEAMFNAAKYVNAYWFPQQTLEIASLLKAQQSIDFAKADGAMFVGRKYSSGSGYKGVHKWLADNNLLQQAPSSGGNCGV